MVVAGTESAVLDGRVRSARSSPRTRCLAACCTATWRCRSRSMPSRRSAAEAGKPQWEFRPSAMDPTLAERVASTSRTADSRGLPGTRQAAAPVGDPQRSGHPGGGARRRRQSSTRTTTSWRRSTSLEKEDGPRQRPQRRTPDRRALDTKTVRPIDVEVGVLPKAHGSALFQRGETQAIVVATLGTLRDAKLIEASEGTYKDNFMLHYNFPPYSVGEEGFLGGPKRREIGHGKLARRGDPPRACPPRRSSPTRYASSRRSPRSNGSSFHGERSAAARWR